MAAYIRVVTKFLHSSFGVCLSYVTWRASNLFLTDVIYIIARIGFTLIYFKMDIMPLVPETKMADVSILISRGNLLTRRTTWLVPKRTSATSISSCVFGAYSMTRILYNYARLPTLTLFSHFHPQGQHAFSCVTSRENTFTLSISTTGVSTLFLLFTFDFYSQPPWKCILHATILFLVILCRWDFF